jgi:hypothetical protein
VSFAQWNTVARQLTLNARLAWDYHRCRSSRSVNNEWSAIEGRGVIAAAPLGSRQLLAKLIWLLRL